MDPLELKLQALSDRLRPLGSAAVAFSGGVDSTFLAKVAHDLFGPRALAVTAVSESLSAAELEEAQTLARTLGLRHVLLHSTETRDERYLENPTNRCYFCKSNVFALIKDLAAREGLAAVLDGANVDDLSDWRPGRAAARELGVLSPLAEAGLRKEDIRELSRRLGLPTWDKPSLACLSSRIPFGTRITLQALSQVDRAEVYLRSLGARQVRVRHHDDTARIEVEPRDFPRILERNAEIVAHLNALGYRFVTLDLAGYRTGSFNPAPPAEAQ